MTIGPLEYIFDEMNQSSNLFKDTDPNIYPGASITASENGEVPTHFFETG